MERGLALSEYNLHQVSFQKFAHAHASHMDLGRVRFGFLGDDRRLRFRGSASGIRLRFNPEPAIPISAGALHRDLERRESVCAVHRKMVKSVKP